MRSYCPHFIKAYTVLPVALVALTVLTGTQSKLVQEITGREQLPSPKKAISLHQLSELACHPAPEVAQKGRHRNNNIALARQLVCNSNISIKDLQQQPAPRPLPNWSGTILIFSSRDTWNHVFLSPKRKKTKQKKSKIGQLQQSPVKDARGGEEE